MTVKEDRVIVQGRWLEFFVRLESTNYTLARLYSADTKKGYYVLMEQRSSIIPFDVVAIRPGNDSEARGSASSKLYDRANEIAQHENRSRGYSETVPTTPVSS